MPKFKPYPHQEYGARLIGERLVVALWWIMRRGKTLATVLGLREAKVKRPLVICPKGIISEWVSILEDYDFEVEGYIPTRKRKLKDGLVINYESVWRDKALVDVSRFDAIVWDESSRLSNFKSKGVQWWFRQIPQFPSVRIMLSGTPCPESLLQVAPQLWILQGGSTKFKGVFRNYVWQNWTWNEWAYKYEPNHPGVEKALEMKMKEIGDTYPNTLALDTKKLYKELEAEPKHEQKKLFKEILESKTVYNSEGRLTELSSTRRDQLLAMASSGIDARNPLDVKFTNSEKLNFMVQYIKDIVDDCPDERFVIFTWYRHSPKRVATALQNLGRCVMSVTGTAEDAVKEFNKGKTRFFIGNERVNRMGINLSIANNIYYFENSWSGEDRIQSEERCSRMDKQEPVQVIDFGTCFQGDNVDLKIATAVKNKQDYNSERVDHK